MHIASASPLKLGLSSSALNKRTLYHTPDLWGPASTCTQAEPSASALAPVLRMKVLPANDSRS